VTAIYLIIIRQKLEVKLPELSISRKTIGMVILLALIILLGLFAYKAFTEGQIASAPTPSVDDTQASAAAIAGMVWRTGTALYQPIEKSCYGRRSVQLFSEAT
jgi:hypothetical protein